MFGELTLEFFQFLKKSPFSWGEIGPLNINKGVICPLVCIIRGLFVL